MADMDNISEINQNFDTIKTLLNSIRAQGILNTSDVDKLLSGINNKLEKINTEEDIDMIKIFLSELKQNLDERHNVLVSKFGAIESLFTNLLKNSSEMPKSADIKELFDIVATNLSVFSREVISQKETLTDITLRLDALRSDDSQKKDIIKNITLLKPDLERLNNGFDSIVISLNDNFKTIVKTISTIDKTEYLDRFSDSLKNIEMSSNTVLSALQMLDKKAELVDESLQNVATKEDLDNQNRHIVELKAQAQEISSSVASLSGSYAKMDNLADKIDASVNIIASLKSVLEESDDIRTAAIIEQLKGLDSQLKEIASDAKFNEFKDSLSSALRAISDSNLKLDKNITASSLEIQRVISLINSLDINVNLNALTATIEQAESDIKNSIENVSQQITTIHNNTTDNLTKLTKLETQVKDSIDGVSQQITTLRGDSASNLTKLETQVKNSIDEVSQKLVSLQDANITRVLNDISSEAENFGSKLSQTQSALAILCEKNFGSVFANLEDLKNVVSQIDENSVSANNAIFSSITDRLTVFENDLRTSLDTQERTVTSSSKQLIEQIDAIKNLSGILDYKMDSSVVETGNLKREFESLKTSVDNVLALDFVNTVKDLRVDLYASKQELANVFESSSSDLSEKFTNDLYGKYELLISKLDAVADEFNSTQKNSLSDLKVILDKISDSIVDVLSYVSEATVKNNTGIEEHISKLANILKENSLNYIDEVKDAVDVVRSQVNTYLEQIDKNNSENFDSVKRTLSENAEELKKELKFSYSKLLEIQDTYSEIKDIIDINNQNYTGKIENVLTSAESIKTDFDKKLTALKNNLLDKVTEFKQEFTCENADKVSELKFSVETLYNKNSQEVTTLIEDLKEQWSALNVSDNNSRASALAKILDNFISVKEHIKSLHDETADIIASKVDTILEDFSAVKAVLDKVDENIDGDMTRQLSIIESNFESLVSQISILFDKSQQTLSDKINEEFTNISETIRESVAEKLDEYKLKIEESFDTLTNKAADQSKYMQERIADLNSALKSVWEEQSEDNNQQLEKIAETLKNIIDENTKLTAVDYVALKNKLSEFAKNIETNNQILTQDLKAQMDDITKYIDSILDIQSQELATKYDGLTEQIEKLISNTDSSADSIKNIANEHSELSKKMNDTLESVSQINENNNTLIKNLETLSKDQHDELIEKENAIYDTTQELDKTTTATAEGVISIKSDIEELTQLVNSNKAHLDELSTSFAEKNESIKTLIADISTGEIQSLGTYFQNVTDLFEIEKQQILLCQNSIIEVVKKELEVNTGCIEKETDIIIGEIVEQFDLLKKSQSDTIVDLTSQIEEIVNTHIYNNIEDLKSYLDIKTDNSVITGKLDNLKVEMTSSVDEIVNTLSKLLDAGVFTTAMSDFRVANELLINTTVDKLNSQIETFIQENGKSFEDKLALFDKKFVDTLVDKFEEIKLACNEYNDAFEYIQKSFADVLSEFNGVKKSINDKFDMLAETIKSSAESTNNEVKQLNDCFENLRSQISSKSFDEAFQSSINKQIGELESLISEQMGYLEDISDLCVNNLPDVTELNTLVKNSILESIKQFTEKLDSQDVTKHLNQVKTDIITQFLNVFNQISFVAEQEEIIDYIQDKHDELITILSHIVTTSADIENVKENLAVVDDKISNLKEDIELINEKITAIMSSDGDIDYVYSLQEVESDIAGLRLALNEIKANSGSQELSDLITSTNEIYNLVESIKKDFPTKQDFENITEDIVSISTRTNKLILASDESYKTLQDNLQEFKLVINDLDERTRNFAHESGMDRIDSKLNALNAMVQNGAKTNQVFNQVFEYLAEWVDKASSQINSISDKVETLDDIGQIKVMLSDLKAEAEDNSESVELIEALGTVFEKQTKRISALEAKLDKLIVETTINKKIDMTPFEQTLNSFLVSMDEKLSSQQSKIDSLESKLEGVLSLLDEKDTAQLTKKVGGMDRQIAKLNKSIEKIASHVVEK